MDKIILSFMLIILAYVSQSELQHKFFEKKDYNYEIKEETNNDLNKENDRKGKKSDEESAYIDYIEADEYSEMGNQYALYDINGDGVEEAIVRGGYIGIMVLNYYNNKVNCIASTKYGSMKIYPQSHIFKLSGGHMSIYYDEYYKVTKKKAQIYANSTWELEFPTGKYINFKYWVGKKKSNKKEYNKKINAIKNRKKISEKELNWKEIN